MSPVRSSTTILETHLAKIKFRALLSNGSLSALIGVCFNGLRVICSVSGMHIKVVERDNSTPPALLRDRGPVQRLPLPLPDLLPPTQAHRRALRIRRQPAHADQDVNAQFQRGPQGLLLQTRQPPPRTARPEACGPALQARLELDRPELNQELAGADQ